ncbi:MAG: AAA family ATPase [Candidatus Aenigmarchaeota archaeon]|nr:AAA family ATPase [Candidatus Aenigmarchaeota archaeon]
MSRGRFADLKTVVNIIGEQYFIDPRTGQVDGEEVPYWNVLMGVATYLGNKNALLVGRPGTGKTTYGGVISSVVSGLPFDLFDFLKIQGHPDQTKDAMLARADIGRLAEEGVVWQPSLYLPAMILDEINRLPPGKQSIIMEYIRTGSVEQLGKHFSRGKVPFFATMNYNGPGTYPLPPASVDRFGMSLEFEGGPAHLQALIQDASGRIQADLADPNLTEEIAKYLLDKDVPTGKKREYLEEKGRERLKKLILPDLSGLETHPLPLSPDATTFLRCIWDEMNTTWRYGENRAVDPQDTTDHNKTFASAHVKEGISPRAWESITFYASIVARYQGRDQVEIGDIQAVSPFCLAHRLEFDEDYKAQFAEHPRLRGEREELDLTRRLLDAIKTNCDAVAPSLKLLDASLAGKKGTEEDVRAILDGPEPDHPLLRAYWREGRMLRKQGEASRR